MGLPYPPEQHRRSLPKPDAKFDNSAVDSASHGLIAKAGVSGQEGESGLALAGEAPLDLFLQSCGGRPALELTIARRDQAAAQKVRRFDQPFILIGRSPDCDLRLRHPEVSRRHAYLQLVDGVWQCVDLGSQNGVYFPTGRRALGALKSDNCISIGPFNVTLSPDTRTPHQPVADNLPTNWSEDESAEVHLEYLNGVCRKNRRAGCVVRQRMTLIGSDPACKIKLNDDSVAAFHASLVLTPFGLWIVDLAGQDRTKVNGEPARWRMLHPGNEIEIGRFRLRVGSGVPGIQSSPPPHSRGPAPHNLASQTAGFSEEFVLALVSQLAGMQERYLEHSREQMLLTGQLLTSMHATTQQTLQGELDRVQEITRELETLRQQMLAGLPLPGTGRTLQHHPLHQTAADANEAPEAVSASDEHGIPGTSPQGSASESAASASASTSSQSRETGSTDRGDVQEHLPKQAAGDDEPVSSSAAKTEPRSKRTRADVDSHAWLMERMALLEEERSSRWRKIIGAITGAGR